MVKMNASSIRTAIRLEESGESQRHIGRILSVGKGTVYRVLERAKEIDVTSIELAEMDDDKLIEAFYPTRLTERRDKQLPDFKSIHERISRAKHRSLKHEWFDYRRANPDGYSYSRFLELYRSWCGKFNVKPVMLRNEVPEDCMYVDWAGDTVQFVFDQTTGVVTTVSFFVTSLGVSELAYVEPFVNMEIRSYVEGHVNALKYYGAVPRVVVPDNCRTAVISHRDKEFTLNKTYEEMEAHYGYVVLPAKPFHPTDKNDAEANVHHAEDYIIGEFELHKNEYHSFREVQIQCRKYLDEMNQQEFKKTGLNRVEWFRDIDLPTMKPLPKRDFILHDRHCMTVPTNYHVGIPGDPHRYSVPCQYIHHEVVIIYDLVELKIYEKDCRPGDKPIAEWQRFYGTMADKIHTMPEHRTANHQMAVETGALDKDWFLSKAAQVGPYTLQVITQMLNSRSNPESMYPACIGVMGLKWNSKTNPVSNAMLEEACRNALGIHSVHYSTIRDYIKMKNAENKEQNKNQDSRTHLPEHGNIRSKDKYK